MQKLALNGGPKIRQKPYPTYVTIGDEEKRAVMEVLDGKVLSQFLGTWSPDFYGGSRVKTLEAEWCKYFKVQHAVSMNSATSCLYAAVGAAGVGPGDEVICSPYTMAASATAALVYSAVPVFADIDPDIFCISAKTIRPKISPRTKAVIVVDIFGHPADMDDIMALAKEHNLIVIEDTAQAPGAKYKGRDAGTLADIGVFSLNYHKTIHCGEGGIATTNSAELAERMQLIRNHAEVVVKGKGVENLVNMVGFNYRMTEIEAAIALEQLKKLESLVIPRIEAADFLTERLKRIPGITPPVVLPEVRHGYYVYAIKFDQEVVGVSRDRFANALKAEGLPLNVGYVEPLYLSPVYQKRIGFGKDGHPFNHPAYSGKLCYDKGLCPITEKMHFEQLLCTSVCHANIKQDDLRDVVNTFDKVMSNINELRALSEHP